MPEYMEAESVKLFEEAMSNREKYLMQKYK